MSSIGQRLKQARLATGLSQRALAEAAKPLSAMAISKYENDKAVPSSDVLLRLAKAIGVKFEYFFRPVAVEISCPQYRRHTRFPKKARTALENRIVGILERYLAVEDVFGPDRFPPFPHTKASSVAIQQVEDAERAAEILRREWELGEDPIDNLCETLEDRGVKVILIDQAMLLAPPKKFHGFSCWANDNIPVAGVPKEEEFGDHQRFTLSHELGHLILKNVSKQVPRERAAHRFAGAFLVPESAVCREYPVKRSSLSLAELYSLKHKWGFSMAAWMHRLNDLGIVSDSTYRRLQIAFRKRGWHHREPGEQQVKPEITRRFERLVEQAVAEDLVSVSRASELLGRSLSDVRLEMRWPEEVGVL